MRLQKRIQRYRKNIYIGSENINSEKIDTGKVNRNSNKTGIVQKIYIMKKSRYSEKNRYL